MIAGAVGAAAFAGMDYYDTAAKGGVLVEASLKKEGELEQMTETRIPWWARENGEAKREKKIEI